MEDRRAARLRWYYKNKKRASKKHAEWKAANKEHLTAYNLAYDERNREMRRTKNAAHRKANHEKSLEQCRKSYARHREKYRALNEAWKAANPDACVTHANNRRARLINAPGRHTVAEWRAILKAHGHRCAYCGVKQSREVRLTRDHYIPLSKGGGNNASNIVPSCKPCNSKKSNRDPIAFAQWLGRLL